MPHLLELKQWPIMEGGAGYRLHSCHTHIMPIPNPFKKLAKLNERLIAIKIKIDQSRGVWGHAPPGKLIQSGDI